MPKPHYTHRFAAKLKHRGVIKAKVGATAPFATAHLVGVVLHLVHDVEQMSHNHLRHRVGAICRNVSHNHIVVAGSVKVYYVVASGKHTHKFQLRQCVKLRLAERHLVGKHNVGFGSPLHYLISCRAFPHSAITQLVQSVPRQIARVLRITV